ncbi:hypothetical protein [Roseovarius sp. TE539]|nr:hypothetical protein [Roseovarius sp. TE539]
MSSDYQQNSLSMPDAVAMETGVVIGAGGNERIGASHLDLPTTGSPT